MTNPQTARDLVAHERYTVSGGTDTALTRKSCLNQEWVFGASGGGDFMIKFDKNFFKKHLVIYSKKTGEVANRAHELWEAGGKPSGGDLKYWLQAETEKLFGKLTKSTSARSEAKVCRTCKKFWDEHKCNVCGHGMDKHIANSGNRKDCVEVGCVCLKTAAVTFNCPGAATPFVASTGDYAAARAGKGKPDPNPLAGAQTSKNTCLILDKVPMTDFKLVLVNAIQAAETNTFTWPVAPVQPMPPVPINYVDPSVKHITWDFGASRKGCVVKVDLSQPQNAWEEKQGLIVSMVKTGVADMGGGRKQYQYCAYHFNGEI